MSADTHCLVLCLQGPMQSWGFASQYKLRATGLLPSKSALAGLCCAALGAARGSEREAGVLEAFRALSMLAVAVPRGGPDDWRRVRRIQDFHTVMGTISAEGKAKRDAVLTHRQYLQDAKFLVLFTGEADFLGRLAEALQNPVWGLWLGRKSCIPSAPVFAGLFDSREQALQHCLPVSLADCLYEEDTPDFGQSGDSYPDQPLSFASAGRRFSTRRVRRHVPGGADAAVLP